MEDMLRNRLVQITASARETGRYWKQDMIRRHKNVCVYGLGKFFADVFADRNFKEIFHVNYLSDADPGKWGKKYEGIECIEPAKLKDIEDLAVIIMLGNTLDVEQKFIKGGVKTFVSAYELLLEMSIGQKFDFEKNEILQVYDLLAEEKSKEIYVELLANRLAPQLKRKTYPELCSPLDYFNGEIFPVTDTECFVDCGAFDGDSIRNFLCTAHDFERIDAFEMEGKNFQRLEQYTASLDKEMQGKIVCRHQGVWHERAVLSYGNEEKSSGEAYSMLKTSNQNQVTADRLDHILAGEKVTFIKMDIEGAELNALKGACGILKEQHSKLAVCLYHKLEDLWEIPMFVQSVSKNYRMGIRHHYAYGFEGTVLYAFCDE